MSKKVVVILLIIVLVAAVAGVVLYTQFWGKGEEESSEVLYEYAIKDAFVTNVKESSRLFKTTVILVLNEKGQNEFLEEHKSVIRDTILFILRSLTEEDIRSSTIQNQLRSTIPTKLNEALGIESIVSVYFSDFVMQ